jgi:hypothetical protein
MTVFDRMSFALRSWFGLWLQGVNGIGAVKCVGILRFAQNDGLRPYELRPCEAGLSLWLQGVNGIGAVKCVGILRFAQDDGLRPYELRPCEAGLSLWLQGGATVLAR